MHNAHDEHVRTMYYLHVTCVHTLLYLFFHAVIVLLLGRVTAGITAAIAAGFALSPAVTVNIVSVACCLRVSLCSVRVYKCV